MTAKELYNKINDRLFDLWREAKETTAAFAEQLDDTVSNEKGSNKAKSLAIRKFLIARSNERLIVDLGNELHKLEAEIDEKENDIKLIIKRHLKIESDTPGIVDFKFTLTDEADDDYIDFREWIEQDPDLKAEIEKYTYKGGLLK